MKKDKTIIDIVKSINESFGSNYFELVDYWDGDNFAFGFKKGNKIIYISTWDFRLLSEEKMKYYSEFEIVNEKDSEPNRISKTFKEVSKEVLLKEMVLFLDN